MKISSVFLLFIVISFNSLVLAEDNIYPITNKTSQFTFINENALLSLQEVKSSSSQNPAQWIDPNTQIPFWTITVLNAKKGHHQITSASGPVIIKKSSKNSIVLEWSGLQPGNLAVQAAIKSHNNSIEWGLEFDVKEPGYTLWDAVYPEIGSLANAEKIHAVIPYGWGMIHKDLSNWYRSEVYPSACRALPFMAVSDGNTGIYAGVQDKTGHAISLFAGKRQKGKGVSFGIRHDVEGMGKISKYHLPYTVTTAVFEGDWYESAQLYKEFAKETPWGKIPELAQRKDVPKWLLDTDLWYLGGCHDPATADQAIAFKKYFDVPTSAHIYNWHEIPFDDHYPEYFPAKPGFKAAIEKVQKAGIAVMPYINGRLWDPATNSWKVKDASSACSLDENGARYVEIYDSKVPLSPMCPSTDIWKSTVTNLVDRLLNEYGVKGVYIDQISAAAAKRCFAENHNHPAGGGTYWIQGYRDLLERCNKVKPKDTILTTEENADPWNDLLDAWLLVNTPSNEDDIIPLYPAVYGGRAVSFGFQYIGGNDFTNKYPFRLKMAQAFVFGSQLGWVSSAVLDPGNTAEAEFLKRLCQARHASRDALQFGELLPPVKFDGGGTVTWKDGGKEQTKPAVFAAGWHTPTKTNKLVFVNVSDQDKNLSFTLDTRHVNAKSGMPLSLNSADKNTSIKLNTLDDGKWQGTINLPARSPMVLEVVGGKD